MNYKAVQYASEEILIGLGLTAKGGILALKRFADAHLNQSAEASSSYLKAKERHFYTKKRG